MTNEIEKVVKKVLKDYQKFVSKMEIEPDLACVAKMIASALLYKFDFVEKTIKDGDAEGTNRVATIVADEKGWELHREVKK